MAKKKKKSSSADSLVLSSPVGEAKWAKIVKPGTKYKSEELEYSIDLILDPTVPANKEYLTKIKAFAKENDVSKLPVNKELDENEDETGMVVIKFKSQKKPRVVDAKKEPIEDDAFGVGNGSKVRVIGAFTVYEGFGGGVTAYLRAVQVIELVEYSEASLDMFDEEDGYTVSGDDDDLPFDADEEKPTKGKQAKDDDGDF